MDLIHKPDDLPFVSDEVVIKDWMDQAMGLISGLTYDPELSAECQMAQQVGCDPSLIPELDSVCDPGKLMASEDDQIAVTSRIREPGNLFSLRVYKDEMAKRASSLSYKQMVGNALKYRRTNFQLLRQYARQSEAKLLANYCPPDVVVTVALMKPCNKPLDHYNYKFSLDVAFDVLGNQLLTELRDRISCLCDFAISEDYSEHPDAPQEVMAKDLYKSGFFYINGTFYNDFRDPAATDLSESIIKWSQATGSRRKQLGPFKRQKMEEVKFGDLTVRFGMPYLYQHQGQCQHLMVFTDLRLLHPEDCQNLGEYPIQNTHKNRARMVCCACKVYTAKWVTYENVRLPFDPGFFCDRCFRAFNYDADGKKVGQFVAVPYVDRHALN